MSFLQPNLLWALPLILLPIIIHLINRLRHKTMPWAAMRFLLNATRNSTSHAKLRQFLILLFRVLAVAMLILFIARPLSGGWLGWAFSGSPDTVILLLDRSASMDTVLPNNTLTRREEALRLFTQTARKYENSHLILIDSATRSPQEIANPGMLSQVSLARGTDTAADLPALFQSALNWILENKAGTTEIWIASDLQQSNWMPDDGRWANLITQATALPQKVRVRLLAINSVAGSNTSLSMREALRQQRGERSFLQCVLDLAKVDAAAKTVTLATVLNGVASVSEAKMESQSVRLRQKVDLGASQSPGWGSFELAADENTRDNKVYFIYGAQTPFKAMVTSTKPEAIRMLQFAAGNQTQTGLTKADVASPVDLPGTSLSNHVLIAWTESLPQGPLADKLMAFASEGGVLVFFPPGEGDTARFNGLGWGDLQSSTEKPFQIARWDEDQGPLARTDEGFSVPITQLVVNKRQKILGNSFATLAAFDDGSPMLVRQTIGRGEIYFLATSTDESWSSLAEGPVLVPMMQRLLQTGSKRLQKIYLANCGELNPADLQKTWTSIDEAGKDVRLQAGVYRSGESLLALNRPIQEEDPAILEIKEAGNLFGKLPFQMLQESGGRKDDLQGELWRMFLVCMLLFLIFEGWLILPRSSPSQTKPSRETVVASA